MERFLAWRAGSVVALVLPLAACTRPSADNAPPPIAAAPSASAAPALAPATAASPLVSIDPVGDARTGSFVALGAVSGKTLAFVADEDGLAVRVVDTATMQETASLALDGRPGQLLVAKTGPAATGQLWVTLRDEASVAVLTLHEDGTLTRSKTLATSVEPLALARVEGDAVGVHPAVLVVSGWGHALERFDAVDFTRGRAVDLPREPRAVLASRDGRKAFVAHAAHGGLSVVSLTSATNATNAADVLAVANVDLGEAAMGGSEFNTEPLAPWAGQKPASKMSKGMTFDTDVGFDGFSRTEQIPARFARQGFALVSYASSSGESVLAPHTEMITGNPKIVSSGYGGGGVESFDLPTEQFGFSTLAAATNKRTSILRPEGHPCQLPRAAALADGNLLVACLGTDEVVAFAAADPSHALARIHVAAGPTGLAVDPVAKNVYVLSSFDGVLTRIPLEGLAPPPKNKTNTHAAFVPAPATETKMQTLRFARASSLGELAERGRRIFHSGGNVQISKDGRACASCHPDGRDDGLVWSTPNGPRQTISLAGRVRHQAPFGWMGKHASLQEHMRSTMKNLKGTGLAPADEDALASYLTSMKGPPVVTAARALTREEETGRAIFDSTASCASCHGGPDKSDHEVHDVQSKTASERSGELLAPSLVGIVGSAPYFHDGRYASLEELLEKTDGKMGSTGDLSTTDKSALVAYLRTL